MRNLSFLAGLTILAILFGCAGQKADSQEDDGKKALAKQKEMIQKHITDPEKQLKLLKIIDEFDIESAKFYSYYEKHINTFEELTANRKTSKEEFQQTIDEFNVQYENYLKTMVNKREEMRLLTNEDEWKKIMALKVSYLPI